MKPEAKKRHTDAAALSMGIDPIRPKRRRRRGLSRRLKIKLAIMTGDIQKAEKLLGERLCLGQLKTELLTYQAGLSSKDLERSGSSLLAKDRRIKPKSGSRSIRRKLRKIHKSRIFTQKKRYRTFGKVIRKADGTPVLHEGQSKDCPIQTTFGGRESVRGYLPHVTQANVTASTRTDRRFMTDEGLNDELTG